MLVIQNVRSISLADLCPTHRVSLGFEWADTLTGIDVDCFYSKSARNRAAGEWNSFHGDYRLSGYWHYVDIGIVI